MSNENVTARLEGWWFDGVVMYGSIYGDTRGRWNDGHPIHTSYVTSDGPYAEGEVIQTKNSRYLLGKPLGTFVRRG